MPAAPPFPVAAPDVRDGLTPVEFGVEPAWFRVPAGEKVDYRSRSGALSVAALVVGVVGLAMYAAAVAAGVGGHVFGVVSLGAALAGAASACGAAALGPARARLGWGLLGVAILAYGVSTVCYAVVRDAAARFPSVLDFGLFAFYPLGFGALVAFVRRRVPGFVGVLWLDCVLGAVVLAAVGVVAVWPQLDGVFNAVVAGGLMYFIGDLGFLGFLLAAFALSGWRRGRSMTFLAAGAALLALLDGVWVVDIAHGAQTPPVLQAIGWPAALLLLAAGALWKVPAVTTSASGWVKVGVAALSATLCLPIVLLSDAATPQNALAGVALGLVVVRFTITLLKNSQLTLTDSLTGLANRQLLLDRIEQGLRRQSRYGRTLAVVFVDLDDFKEINDSRGHDVGDRVLVAVGDRLRMALRREDTVARERGSRDTISRLGGDEFVVLLEGLRGPDDAGLVVARVLSELQAPLVVDAHAVSLEASAGVSVAPPGEVRGAVELVRDADTAMYAAKRAGKGRYELFQADMRAEVIARTDLIHALRYAVADGQLRLLYQPQVDVFSGHITGVEALVRWEHPERGLLTPDRFITAAESAGLIAAIDDWVMHEACAQLGKWDAAGLPALQMAVNVSAGRLVTGDLAGDIAAMLSDTLIGPERLEVEITETVAVDYDGEAVDAIRGVRDLGVRVAIDDFGMGHSALSRLQSFPVDRLKIDRSFVFPLTSHGARGSIADAMIALGQSLGLEVLAEGVETREHLHALRALGCRTAQGYLFSRPVAAEQIASFARAGAPLSPAADQPVALDAFDFEPSTANQERLTRTLLAELQRVTGLETTYLTSIHWEDALQHITHARNTGTIDIPEGLVVDWSSTVCRRALEQGITYTDDVRATFPDSEAGEELGLQTYLSVPLLDHNGDVQGTLCGASSKRVTLGPEAVLVAQRFGEIITQGVSVARPGDPVMARDGAR